MWDTDKGRFERLCWMQYVCVGICVIHCLVCSLLAQTAGFAGAAQSVNINSNKHNLSEVGSISATDPYPQLSCVSSQSLANWACQTTIKEALVTKIVTFFVCFVFMISLNIYSC